MKETKTQLIQTGFTLDRLHQDKKIDDEAYTILKDRNKQAINYSHCCTELPTIEDANSEMYKVSNNLKTDHKQTEVNYYESGFLTCYYWLAKRLKK